MKRIQIPEKIFTDESQFHQLFARTMGFPDFYGRNWDAWIDCMSCIDAPHEEMSKITVAIDESLEIEIAITDGNDYFKTDTWGTFCSCVAAINGRFARRESRTRLIITEKISA